MQNRLQPAFSARNAFQGENIVDATPYLNSRVQVNAPNQPYAKINPRNVTNPDSLGVPNAADRVYWKSKNRVDAPINPKVPKPQDRAYWRSKRVVNNDEKKNDRPRTAQAPLIQPKEDGTQPPKSFEDLPQEIQDRLKARFPQLNVQPPPQPAQAHHVRANAQPFNANGLTPQQNLQRPKAQPDAQDRAYWRSKNRVDQEQKQRIPVNGVMTEVKFVAELPRETDNEVRFEVQGTQGIQSAIIARNQELAKLNALRAQQAQVEDKRAELLNKVNQSGFQHQVQTKAAQPKQKSFLPKNK
jgi:hypothetical protein